MQWLEQGLAGKRHRRPLVVPAGLSRLSVLSEHARTPAGPATSSRRETKSCLKEAGFWPQRHPQAQEQEEPPPWGQDLSQAHHESDRRPGAAAGPGPWAGCWRPGARAPAGAAGPVHRGTGWDMMGLAWGAKRRARPPQLRISFVFCSLACEEMLIFRFVLGGAGGTRSATNTSGLRLRTFRGCQGCFHFSPQG